MESHRQINQKVRFSPLESGIEDYFKNKPESTIEPLKNLTLWILERRKTENYIPDEYICKKLPDYKKLNEEQKKYFNLNSGFSNPEKKMLSNKNSNPKSDEDKNFKQLYGNLDKEVINNLTSGLGNKAYKLFYNEPDEKIRNSFKSKHNNEIKRRLEGIQSLL